MLDIFMQDWIWFVIIMLIAAIVAGFMAGLFGIGGGAVMVPVFSEVYVWVGTEPSLAQFVAVGTSLAIIIPTSIRSAQTHFSAGNLDHKVLRSYFWFIPLGVVLGLVFANLDWVKASDFLTSIFGIMALLISAYMLFEAKEFSLRSTGPRVYLSRVGGVVIGFTSLLMGIGGGVVNNIFMMLQGSSIKVAIGTSAAVGILISVPGALGFLVIGWGIEGLPPFTYGFLNVFTMLVVIPITVLMAPLGAKVTQMLPDALTSRLFGFFLLAAGMRMLWKVLV
ncbi:MAG: sulfite exporter TauE/SafE family protein [Alphaproteobacteria bacterium]